MQFPGWLPRSSIFPKPLIPAAQPFSAMSKITRREWIPLHTTVVLGKIDFESPFRKDWVEKATPGCVCIGRNFWGDFWGWMGCGVPCGRASPVQCWGDYRGPLYSGTARIASWFHHRFIDLRARSVSIWYPLPTPRFLSIVALGWAQEKNKDWDVLHIASASSMFLGRIFLVRIFLLILSWLSVAQDLAIGASALSSLLPLQASTWVPFDHNLAMLRTRRKTNPCMLCPLPLQINIA